MCLGSNGAIWNKQSRREFLGENDRKISGTLTGDTDKVKGCGEAVPGRTQLASEPPVNWKQEILALLFCVLPMMHLVCTLPESNYEGSQL